MKKIDSLGGKRVRKKNTLQKSAQEINMPILVKKCLFEGLTRSRLSTFVTKQIYKLGGGREIDPE
jgi:hypothetical protein